jgi:TM2 domain-containing membrane protein YozV
MSANWYYSKNNEREGPVTPAKLKKLASEGWLTPDDLVWKEGMPNWLPARKVRGLFESRLVQQLNGTVDGALVSDARTAATQTQLTAPPAYSPARTAVPKARSHSLPSLADLPPRYILAGGGGLVAALGLAWTVAGRSPVALSVTVLGLCLTATGLYEELGRLLRQAAENVGKASREAAERRQEARRIALEHRIEAKRLAQEQAATQQPLIVPAGTPDGGFAQPAAASVVVINQAPLRRWSPGLAAVLSFFLPGLGQLYKGQIINAVVWFFFVALGYAALILPGLVLHFFCVLGALSGNPWTEPKTTVVRH